MARDDTPLVRRLQVALDETSSAATRRWWTRYLIADWNTCHWFCVRVLGPTIAANGRRCASAVATWSTSRHLWKARASVVGFVPVIGVPDHHPLVLRSSAALIRRNERFAKTAVGWILRDLSKHDVRLVRAFLDEHLVHFSTESLRNALKYMPEATRRRLLSGMKAAQQQRAIVPRRTTKGTRC